MLITALSNPGTILFTLFALAACEKTAQQYNYSILAFGTLIEITFYDVDKKKADYAHEQLQQDFDKFHHNWSPWTEGDLAALNQQLQEKAVGGESIQVPQHLVPIIRRSIKLSSLSENNFNPAIGKLINLWQFHKYQDKDIQPPDSKKIKDLTDQNPDMGDISFNGDNSLRNTNPAVSLNFGAFAKGYAIELEMEKLKKMGIQNAIINAGGDLSVIGMHGDRAWNIGIRHPRENSIIASVEVKNNESVFTSGDYERYYFYESERFHHILDPSTGYPAQNARSVTILHENAGLADAAATAIFVAGSKKWQHIARNMDVRHVMLIDAEGNIHLTPEMEKRIKFYNMSPASRIIVSEEL